MKLESVSKLTIASLQEQLTYFFAASRMPRDKKY
jgi:hypothetical protein